MNEAREHIAKYAEQPDYEAKAEFWGKDGRVTSQDVWDSPWARKNDESPICSVMHYEGLDYDRTVKEMKGKLGNPRANPAFRGHVGIYAEKELPETGAYPMGVPVPVPGKTEEGVPSAAIKTLRREVPLVAENKPLANVLECPHDGDRLVYRGLGNTDRERGVMVYQCKKCKRTYRKKR